MAGADLSRIIENARQTIANGIDDRHFLDNYPLLEQGDLEGYLQLMTNTTSHPWSIDISPAYSSMNQAEVDSVARILDQNTPIFYLVRDVVDRSYAQANLHFHLHGSWNKPASLSHYISLLSEKSQVRRNDYTRTIDIWRTAFGDKNVHVLFYDDLIHSPAETMNRIFNVLGTADKEILTRFTKESMTADTPVTGIQAPTTLKGFIAASSLQTIANMAARYPKEAGPWFDHALSEIDQCGGSGIATSTGNISAAILTNPANTANPGRRTKNTSSASDTSTSTPATPATPIKATSDTLAFLSRFVSLGDNCEFGFFLRSLGNEKGGLFRWSIAHINAMIAYLDHGCPPLYQFENLVPHSAGMVKDTRSNFCFHTAMRSTAGENRSFNFNDAEKVRRKIHSQELEKMEFLRLRFLNSLESPDSLFILKQNGNLADDEIMRLQEALVRYRQGLSTRIIAVLSTDNKESVGSIEQITTSVWKGYISRFAPYAKADDIDGHAWLNIILSASRAKFFSECGDVAVSLQHNYPSSRTSKSLASI